ncbi:DoxX family protein [Streptomyces scopuliridis]|uniref:Membrane protein n=1 Tax=Streptomyces scopuliridis RB72 TaxID=1440053 RepID=A0A2T7SPD8_9ACTN|nr:DoxX family protein [Streptomyces scopuliridis]PVE04705.1 membrane protein [Streptomyces scopuliridis RB72]
MSDASTTPAAAVSESPRPSRRAHLTARVLQIVLALFFGIASAAPKLIGHSSAKESFDAIGFGDWFMYLTGALELAGAIALVIPILSGVSALALIGLMIGALIAQLTAFGGQNALTPVVLIVPLAVIARVRRNHTAELSARIRGRG